MDKVEKFLRRASHKQRLLITLLIQEIEKGNTKGLNIKKLKDTKKRRLPDQDIL